jgi:hypothetical protein
LLKDVVVIHWDYGFRVHLTAILSGWLGFEFDGLSVSQGIILPASSTEMLVDSLSIWQRP